LTRAEVQMTAQASDRIIYRDQEFSLVGWEGAGLFDPAQYGLKPFQVSTGNWVGYICTYAVADGVLRLERLEIGFGADDRAASLRGAGPLLFGVRPRLAEQDSYALYENLGQNMAFSGTLTLGADFVWDMYVHMGLHPPWKYRVVWDLTFATGKLVQETDRSADMARMREAEATGGLAGLFKPLTPTP
jgi:hypothetical protein